MKDTKEKVMDIFNSLSEEEKRIFVKVLKAEKNKIHLKKPSGIYDDITDIIREEIK